MLMCAMELSLQQVQRQVLSQQMIQSQTILGLSTVDLRDKIFDELNENPTLEIVHDSLEQKKIQAMRSEYPSQRKKNGTADEYQSFLESIPDSLETLQTHLLNQFKLLSLSESEMTAGEYLIQNLDDRGYNAVPIERLFNTDENKCRNIDDAAVDIKKITDLIQRLEPIGCCTNDALDSLRVQANIRFAKRSLSDNRYAMVIDLLENHRELFKLNGVTVFFTELKKINGEYAKITFQKAKELLDIIGTLQPVPGAHFMSRRETRYIIPEIFVVNTEDGLQLTVNDAELPVLKVSDIFTEEKNESKKSKDLKDKITKANQFIDALYYRRQTLLKVTNALLLYQKDFFLYGIKYLRPLTQAELANELSVSVSTISRTVNGKYLQCDWGIFELSYFFGSGIAASGIAGQSASGTVSKEAVKSLVKKIASENPKITDAKIVEMLTEQGIKIARRTVNKYRNE